MKVLAGMLTDCSLFYNRVNYDHVSWCFVIVALQSKTLILKARLWFHKVDMGLSSCMDKI